jgi:hypothetical protein
MADDYVVIGVGEKQSKNLFDYTANWINDQF